MTKTYPTEGMPSPRYHPDTRERIAQTFQTHSERLGRAFRERIALVKGRRR